MVSVKTPRPEIFISATSADLSTCRQLIKEAILSLDCTPVEQTNFPPEASSVKDMLRKRIGQCDAVVHVAGEVYGAEPSQRESSESRRSYTQLEYDIARELGKPVYVFVCGKDFPYDEHEAEDEEKRRLQDQHRADLQSTDQVYTLVESRNELSEKVYQLQTKIEELDRALRRSQTWLKWGLATGAVILLSLVVALVFFNLRLARLTQFVIHGEVPTAISDLSRDDFFIREHMRATAGLSLYTFTIYPRSQALSNALGGAEMRYALDGEQYRTGSLSSAVRLRNQAPPEEVKVKVLGPDGEQIGPFTYDLTFESKLQQQVDSKIGSGNWLTCDFFVVGVSRCTSTLPPGSNDSIEKVALGPNRKELEFEIVANDAADNTGATKGANPASRFAEFLVPLAKDQVFAKLYRTDGRDAATIHASFNTVVREGGGQSFEFVSETENAPVLVASLGRFRDIYAGRWNIVPIVGKDVIRIEWRVGNMEKREMERHEGFFAAREVDPGVLGVTRAWLGGKRQKVVVTYAFDDGSRETHEYSPRWKKWLKIIDPDTWEGVTKTGPD